MDPERAADIWAWCDARLRCPVICLEAERTAESLADRAAWVQSHDAHRCASRGVDCVQIARYAAHYLSTDLSLTAILLELTRLSVRLRARERAIIANRFPGAKPGPPEGDSP